MKVKKYCKPHIGKTFSTNEGYQATVIGGGTKPNYCTVQIKGYVTEAQFSHVKRGSIKYPFHPNVYGKGYIGIGKYTSSKADKKLYETWRSMLKRCYDPEVHQKCPTYTEATVCDEWLNLQVFGKWFTDNYVDGYALDKDLLVIGNKSYSSETCTFIPQRLNSFLAGTKSTNTSGHTGACWHKRDKRWTANISIEGTRKHLGDFSTAEEAAEAYKQARKLEALKLQELYKDILPETALAAIR